MISFQSNSGDCLSGRVHSPAIFKLVVISDPEFLSQEHIHLCELLQAGIYRLHIRKPAASVLELSSLIEKIPEQYYSRISLHDHHSLVLKYGLGGIHLNRRNPQLPEGFDFCRNADLSCNPLISGEVNSTEHTLLSQRPTISRSCHSLEELTQYKPSADYLFLSPIFDSVSKQGYSSQFPVDELIQARDGGVIDSKVFALSGILPERIPLLRSLGFGGCAVLGYIWDAVRKGERSPIDKLITATQF